MLIDAGTPNPSSLAFRSRKISFVWLCVSLLLDQVALYIFMQGVALGKGTAPAFWRDLFQLVPFWMPIVLVALVLPTVLWCALRVVSGASLAKTSLLGLVAAVGTLILGFALLYLYSEINYLARHFRT